MPIKGLTDQITSHASLDRDVRGRAARVGNLGKGKRTGFGKDIKLVDLPHFVFAPVAKDKGMANQLANIFARVYGPAPTAFPDIRIPEPIAGNFRMEDQAWMAAYRHTERGSTFIARSDGESILAIRDEEDSSKVIRLQPGEMLLEEHTVTGEKTGRFGALKWRDKLYPWQRALTLDLVFTDFNQALSDAGLPNGTVAFRTTSTNDIVRLTQEYEAILDRIAALLVNPLNTAGYESVRKYAPLNMFPLMLYRRTEKISTPSFDKSKSDERQFTEKSLVHLDLAPDIWKQIHIAEGRKQLNMLEAIGSGATMQQHTMASVNEDLFGIPAPQEQPALPATTPVQEAHVVEAVDPDEEAQWEEIPDDEPETHPLLETPATRSELAIISTGANTFSAMKKICGSEEEALQVLRAIGKVTGHDKMPQGDDPETQQQRLLLYRAVEAVWKDLNGGLKLTEAISQHVGEPAEDIGEQRKMDLL